MFVQASKKFTDSNKDTSLLHDGIYYGRKKFMIKALEAHPSVAPLSGSSQVTL